MAKRAARAAPGRSSKGSVAAKKGAAEPQSTSVRPDALVTYKNKRNFGKVAADCRHRLLSALPSPRLRQRGIVGV